VILELRQYTLHPGQRDVLIDLFEREFVESQETVGMSIIGTFRDLDDPDRFVWLRGFSDMDSRAAALAAFYGGPAWRAHRDAANATMIDSDNVLLLRPVGPRTGFDLDGAVRPPVGARPPSSVVYATICYRDRPASVADPLALLETEPAENTFPALPVRTGEDVFVWFSRSADPDPLPSTMERLRLAPTARSLLR
jgi:NIPSNAP